MLWAMLQPCRITTGEGGIRIETGSPAITDWLRLHREDIKAAYGVNDVVIITGGE